MRVLYIHSTVVPPPVDKSLDRFFLLSESLEGDVIQPIWTADPENVLKTYGRGTYPVYQAGRFRYHWLLEGATGFRRTLSTFWFCLRTGVRLHRERPFDCIITYSHMTTALFGVALKILTGARLIVEIATSPDLVYISERPRPGVRERVMKVYSDFCLNLSLLSSDRAHCLYPTTLSAYPLLKRVPVSVFHEFVPVAAVKPAPPDAEQFVILVGAPWYLKGADVLMEAFHRLAADFPEVRLKIVGHFQDSAELQALTLGSPRIEILKALRYPDILNMIARARVLVLPSRCEGMGRVLIEAMAAGVPVIGSDAGGIPYMIRDGENGFIVPRGDSSALETRLRQILEDETLAQRMGERGREMAHRLWDERAYVNAFTRMVEETVEPARANLKST